METLKERLRAIAAAVEARRCRLNKRETSFLTELRFQMLGGGKISPRQEEIVEKLWRRASRNAVARK